jgi:hypothetical protein
MSESKMDYSFIADLIAAGETDDIIALLIDTAVARRNYLRDVKGAVNKVRFVPGTKVRLVNISPKYMHGVTGVVGTQTPKRRGDLMVEIDPSCYHRLGRFGHVLGVPASSLEEVL